MNMKHIIIIIGLLFTISGYSQKAYTDSIQVSGLKGIGNRITISDNTGKLDTTNVYYSSGIVGIGTNTFGSSLLYSLRVQKGQSWVDIGSAGTGQSAIWFSQVTPTASNYALRDAGGESTYFNCGSGSGAIYLQNAATNIATFGRGYVSFFPSQRNYNTASSTFLFTNPANLNQQSSTEISGFKVVGSERQWLTGNIVNQRENYFTGHTYSAVGTTTITNAYGFYVEKATVGTNVTITNNFAAGFGGSIYVSEDVNVNNDIIADTIKARKQFISLLPTGTPPLVVASSTKVDSLNVGLFDGKHASDFQLKSDTLTFDATLSDLGDSTKYLKENAVGSISISVSGERLALNQTKVIGGAPVSDMIQRVTVDHDGLMTKDQLKRLTDTVPKLSGTLNYLQKVTGTNAIGNSNLIDYGSYLSSSVQFNAPIFYAGSTAYSAGNIDLGFGRTGDNFAYIDFIGDQTYTDYGLRIIRGNTGANTYTQFNHRGTGDFAIKAQDAGRVILGTKNVDALIIDTLQNVGIGAIDTTYELNVAGKVNSTGGFFKNGVEIGSGGINYIGMTMPTGLSVSPANLTANGTFTISYPSGYTYFTDSERSIYSNANQKRITSASFSGTTTKTLTLNQVDGGVLQASFTDLQGTSQWTADTYGINYQSGNVGVGTASIDDHKIYAYGLNANGIKGKSGTAAGVTGESDSGWGVWGLSNTNYGGVFSGLGVLSPKYSVSSLNTAPASSTATGTTGEIRFTSDYIYVCVAPNTWKRTAISTW